jgi:homoserine O-acetyltransferase
MNEYKYAETFTLESGAVLNEVSITYHTWGVLNTTADNVIWICHALTANSNAAEWWPGMIGPGLIFDTDKYFVVCANMLGSCYGTTGPSSINEETHNPYYHQFPAITVRDMVSAHRLLRNHLGINQIHTLVGGSMGGYQALEWCLTESQHISSWYY